MTTTLSSLPQTSKALAKQGTSLLDVMRAIQLDAAAKSPEPTKVTLPKKVAVSPVQAVAVAAFPSLLVELKLPQVRRKLTAAEKANILTWAEQAKSVESLAKTVVEQLKAAFFNHADVVAEESGKAKPGETPRDKSGWYLANDKDDNGSGIVPDAPLKMTRELKSGSVKISVASIDELIASGVLTAEDRQACVETVERVDEDAVMALLADRPHLVLPVAEKVEQSSSPSVAFHLRKNA
jgi:hypothetical protein